MITVLDPNESIWEINPHLELLSYIKEFKIKFGDKKSSIILTGIYLMYDPKSVLRNRGLTDEEIVEEVTNNYLTDITEEEVEEVKSFYLEKMLSKTEKLFLRYEKDITDLKQLLDNWGFSKENIKERSSATKEYKSLLEEYLKLKTQVEEEKKSTASRGNYKKSLLEQYGTS